jgi:hypothetical protein
MTNYTEDVKPIVELSDSLHVAMFGEFDDTQLTRERAEEILEMFNHHYNARVVYCHWAKAAARHVSRFIEEHMKEEYTIEVYVPTKCKVTVTIKADSITEAVDQLMLGGEEADGLQCVEGAPTSCCDIAWDWDSLQRSAVDTVNGQDFDPNNEASPDNDCGEN